MGIDWGAAPHLVMQVAAEQMVPEGWRVGVRSERVEGSDAHVYEFTFTKTLASTSRVTGLDVDKLQSDEDAVAYLERLIGNAIAEAGVNEVERLRAWKDEAMVVLDEWNELADEAIAHLGDPAALIGRRKVDIVRMVVGSAP